MSENSISGADEVSEEHDDTGPPHVVRIDLSESTRSTMSAIERIRQQHEALARSVRISSAPMAAELARIEKERMAMLEGHLLSATQQMQDMLRPIRFPTLSTQIPASVAAPTIDLSDSVSRSLAPSLEALESFRALVGEPSVLAGMQRLQLPRIAELDDAILANVALRSAIDDVQASLSPSVQRMVESLNHMEMAARSIWDEADPEAWALLPVGLRDTPALGLFEATRSTAGAVGIKEVVTEGAPTEEPFLLLPGTDLASSLAEVDKKLPQMYHGALKAFDSQGPDWRRQTSVSMREMISHLLVRLAPKSNVLDWNPDAERTDSGELTRKARIAYLLRNLNESYARYAESDNQHIQQTAIFLNTGVHEPALEISRDEFRLFIRRCEFAVLFLLDARKL